MAWLKKLYNIHSLIVTALIFGFIYLFWFFFLNMHFLDPFNYGVRDYEVTDIVFSQLRDTKKTENFPEIVIVNTGPEIDRRKLAMLLDRFRQLNPRSIGLDVLLDERKEPASVDTLLKQAIDSLPQLVLAGQLTKFQEDKNRFTPLSGCHPFFCDDHRIGFINFVSEDTSTIRLFSPLEKTDDGLVKAFPVLIAENYDSLKTEKLFRRKNKVERIYYSGDLHSFVRIDAETFLDSARFEVMLQKDLYKDKILLVGYLGNHQPGEPELDRFFTPLNKRYTGKSYPDMYGLEIHANILAMILHERYIFEFPWWLMELFSWIYCYINVIIIRRIYKNLRDTFHGITRLLQIVEFLLIFFLISLLFYFFQVKIEFHRGILGMVLAYDFVMIYESLIRKNLKTLQNPKT